MSSFLKRSSRKYPYIFLLAAIIASVLAISTTAFGAAGDSEQDPIHISECSGLEAIPQSPDAYYILDNDVSGCSTIIENTFTGHLDGNNKTITNVYHVAGDDANAALFENTNHAEIKNLTIGGSVSSGSARAAALVITDDGSTFDNVHSTATVSTGGLSAGGLIGYAYHSTITNASAIGDVSAASGQAGGLIGYIDTSTVSDSYATGDVSSTDDGYIGGFASTIDYSTLTHVFATGNVTTNQRDVGGFVGVLEFGSTITNAFARGIVTGTDEVGGFVGLADGVSDGFVIITDSYSTGMTSGTDHVGGFAGNSYSPMISNSYYDQQTSGLNVSQGGAPLNSGHIKDPSFLTSFDFDTVWETKAGFNDEYACLRSVPYGPCGEVADAPTTTTEPTTTATTTTTSTTSATTTTTVPPTSTTTTSTTTTTVPPETTTTSSSITSPTTSTSIPAPSSLSDSTVGPDGTITVTASGFKPDSDVDVTLHSTPVLLGTFHTNGVGSITAQVTIPANTSLGAHQIVISGVDASGNPLLKVLDLTVASLPATGTHSAQGTLIALTLLLAGTGFSFASRSKNRVF